MNPFSIIAGLASSLIPKIFANKDDQEKAKIELFKMQQDGEFKELEIQLSAIVAEAKSNDKWTSRARPGFLYVMYFMILISFPMGILHAVNPGISASIAVGMKEWLAAIPEYLWSVFGIGFTGYVAARSFDKSKILNKK